MRNILFLVLFASVLFSCTDEGFELDKKKTSKTMTFKDYYALINNNADDQILIQSVGTLNNSGKIHEIHSASKTSAAPLDFSIDGKSFMTSDVNRNGKGSSGRILSNHTSELYGRKVKMQLSRKDAGSSVARVLSEEAELYIPEEIKAHVSGLVNDQVVPGTTFSWNADPHNTNGVILAIKYKYSNQKDPKIIEEVRNRVTTQAGGRTVSNNGDFVTVGLTAADNGSYRISAQDISQFPPNTYLSFYIIRLGHTTVVNEKNEETVVAAYSSLRADFTTGK